MRSARIPINIVLGLLILAITALPQPSSGAAESASSGASSQRPPGAADEANEAKAKKEKKKKKKIVNRIRIHVEAKRELPERSLPAIVGRNSPLIFNVEKIPILNESHVENALLVDEPGGFMVRIRFNSMGAKLLESYSSAAAGRHLCVITDIDGEARWLAAPLVRQRIGDGMLSFTPDASREEMERLVLGLNETIRKEKKRWLR